MRVLRIVLSAEGDVDNVVHKQKRAVLVLRPELKVYLPYDSVVSDRVTGHPPVFTLVPSSIESA